METVENMRAERDTINRQIEALRVKASDLSRMICEAEVDPNKVKGPHSMAFIVTKNKGD